MVSRRYTKVLEAQKLVCAPVYIFGDYIQIAHFRSSLPITEATLRGGESAYHQTFDVRFHDEHLRRTSSTNVSVGMDDRKFVMTIFATLEEAAKHQRWVKRVFGFICEDKYYLVSDP
jgi:hypothetical protein